MWNVICRPRTYFGPTQHLLQFPLCWIAAGYDDFGIYWSLAHGCLWFEDIQRYLTPTQQSRGWTDTCSAHVCPKKTFLSLRVSSAASQNVYITVIKFDFDTAGLIQDFINWQGQHTNNTFSTQNTLFHTFPGGSASDKYCKASSGQLLSKTPTLKLRWEGSVRADYETQTHAQRLGLVPWSNKQT